jgi:glycosyltransferase involved in cell wall biosynthesis
MKVVVLVNGLTHYYKLILNKLSSQPGVDLVVIGPGLHGCNIGTGVYQNSEGIEFRFIEAEETCFWPFYCTFKGLAAVLWRERPAIVVVPDIYIAGFILIPFLCLITRIFRIKLIMQSIPFQLLDYPRALVACGEESEIWERFPFWMRRIISFFGLEYWLRRAYLGLRRRAFNKVDAHLNYIDDAYAVFGSYGVPKRKIFITNNSPDTDLMSEIENNLPQESGLLAVCSRRVVHVGRLVKWKRVDMLLRAFARVRVGYTDAELLIIGSGPEEVRLKQLAIDLKVDDFVSFAGPVYDPARLANYLRACTVYVLAGMGGLSINEAMFHRLPIVCSVADGTEKKLVRDGYNGFFFIEGSEDDLVGKIGKLLQDPARCREMGRNSRRIIDQEVNIRTMIDGYLKAFEFVSSPKPLKVG